MTSGPVYPSFSKAYYKDLTTYTSESEQQRQSLELTKTRIYVNNVNNLAKKKKQKKLRLNSFNQCKLIECARNEIQKKNINQNYSKNKLTFDNQIEKKKYKYFSLVVIWLF